MVCSLIVSGLHFPSQSVRQPMDLMKSMINKLGPIFNNVCSQQATDYYSCEKKRQLHGQDIFKYSMPVCEAVLVAHGYHPVAKRWFKGRSAELTNLSGSESNCWHNIFLSQSLHIKYTLSFLILICSSIRVRVGILDQIILCCRVEIYPSHRD